MCSSLSWCGRLLVLGGSAGSASLAAAQTQVDLLGAPFDRLGSLIEPAGDFDRDGFPDALITATQDGQDPSQPLYVSGRVAILSGKDGHVLFEVTGDDYAALTGFTTTSFGVAGCMIGDLDQDATSDVAVVHGTSRSGRMVAFFSGRTGALLSGIVDPLAPSNFGDGIARLGDLLDAQGNLAPDGVADFAISAATAPAHTPPFTYPGFVYVYSGASATLGPVVTLAGRAALDGFGRCVVLVGDIDGDGKPGLAVSALAPGTVEIFDGPGFASQALITSPFAPAAQFGFCLGVPGDLDNDGEPELAVGAPSAASGTGRVVIYSLKTNLVVTRLQPLVSIPGEFFGSSLASLPLDPLTGAGLLDLDHDATPDPFLDWNQDGNPDFVVGARGYPSFAGGPDAGLVFLVAGTGSPIEVASERIRQGVEDPQFYPYLPNRSSQAADGFGERLALLGNRRGESQFRLAIGTEHDDGFRGSAAFVRPPLVRFDDDTFSHQSDGVGTSRTLFVDFGPAHRRRVFYLLGSAGGAHPAQVIGGYTIPLVDDGPGGLWRRTASGVASGTPLSFSSLTGRLDGMGRTQITVTVTGPTVGHPWFSGLCQNYLVTLLRPGGFGQLEDISAPVPLRIE